jgi:hypothetical protein
MFDGARFLERVLTARGSDFSLCFRTTTLFLSLTLSFSLFLSSRAPPPLPLSLSLPLALARALSLNPYRCYTQYRKTTQALTTRCATPSPSLPLFLLALHEQQQRRQRQQRPECTRIELLQLYGTLGPHT